MVHDDGDQEDLEEYEVQQARSEFVQEARRLNRSYTKHPVVRPSSSIVPVDTTNSERRKRRKPDHYVPTAAHVKCSASDTGTGQDGRHILHLADDINEVERLKQHYTLLSGATPRGSCASNVTWLRVKIAELEMSTGVLGPEAAILKKPNSENQSEMTPASFGTLPATAHEQGDEMASTTIQNVPV